MGYRMMKIILVILFYLSGKVVLADDISNKNLGQGVGAFVGVLSGQLLEINNPYALATGGLLGMFIGGRVGEHMDKVDTMHQRQCRDFITGDNRKGVACMQDNEWVVVKLEGQ